MPINNPKGHADNLTNRSGRPKGSKNKFTNFKQSCLNVYEKLGGDKAFAKWARGEPKEFYTMMARMLPKPVELSAPPGEGVQLGVILLPAPEEEGGD